MSSIGEKRICRIIKRIQANRNTAGYQNILAFAKREDKDLTMEHIKETINDLLEREMIVDKNKGKDGKTCKRWRGNLRFTHRNKS